MPMLVYDDDVLNPQPDRPDPLPPGPPATADPLELSSDPDAQRAQERIQSEQKVDLAMLRLFFRFLTANENERKKSFPDYPYRDDIDHAKFNQIATAVIRIHDDEREVYGFGKNVSVTGKPLSNPDENEYEKLTQLTKHELIQLCNDNGIVPPNTCYTEIET